LSDKRKKITPLNPDIDYSKSRHPSQQHQTQNSEMSTFAYIDADLKKKNLNLDDVENAERDLKIEVMDSYGTESKEAIKLVDEELGILSIAKRESVSPKFIIQKRKESITHFAWDSNFTPDVMEITANNRGLFLKEEAYLFRSVIADKGFHQGLHYWEIIADARTENELKIGV
jgi:hypothetical protein